MANQLRPYLLEWDAGTSYPVGITVVDAGSLWQALVWNRNSRPAAGNANWTLVLAGGTPTLPVDPANPATGGLAYFIVVAGKVQFRVIFPTGDPQILASET